jgi:hypothetical protein
MNIKGGQTVNATSTNQSITIDSKEGRAFLRKVAGKRHDWAEEWSLYANASDGWRVTFWRSVRGAIGEPDSCVTVVTDSAVRQDGRTGLVRSFEDSAEVVVPTATRVWLRGGDARTAAKLLLDGWHFRVQHSSGSTSSSHHGLAFLSLQAERRGPRPNDNWDAVEIGGSTTVVHGTIVCRGAVE